MRIVSLLPSATETLCALGLGDQIVGISHACDYPPEIVNRPPLTKSVLSEDLPSAEIHRRVQESAAGRARLYTLDTKLLAKLEPDLIVTHGIGGDDARAAARGTASNGAGSPAASVLLELVQSVDGSNPLDD